MTESGQPNIPVIAPEIPYDTRPISKQEFMSIIRGFQSESEFSRLPLPAFAYKELPEYKGTELGRLEENAEYAVKQATASTEEERLHNMKERLRRKLEAKKAIQK